MHCPFRAPAHSGSGGLARRDGEGPRAGYRGSSRGLPADRGVGYPAAGRIRCAGWRFGAASGVHGRLSLRRAQGPGAAGPARHGGGRAGAPGAVRALRRAVRAAGGRWSPRPRGGRPCRGRGRGDLLRPPRLRHRPGQGVSSRRACGLGPPGATGPAGRHPRLVELAEEVQEFHARPPMWRQPEPGVSQMVEQGYRRAIEDGPGLHLLVVAGIPGSRLVGLMQAAPDGRFTGAVTIGLAGVTQRFRSTGIGTALLNAVTDWSAGLGFARCGAGWTSANPVSDRFWRSRGLVPEAYRMSRVIDHRPPAVPQIPIPVVPDRDGSPP